MSKKKWYICKYIKLFVLSLCYFPFMIFSVLCKLIYGKLNSLINIILIAASLFCIYKIAIEKTNSYIPLFIMALICTAIILLLKYSIYTEMYLKSIIIGIYKCPYGYHIVWNKTNRTNTVQTQSNKDNSSLDYDMKAIYEEKTKIQKEYYEKIIDAKKKELDEIRRKNEHTDFFIGVENLAGLKKRYRELLKVYHPDNEGGNILMTVYLKEKYEEEFKKYK